MGSAAEGVRLGLEQSEAESRGMGTKLAGQRTAAAERARAEAGANSPMAQGEQAVAGDYSP